MISGDDWTNKLSDDISLNQTTCLVFFVYKIRLVGLPRWIFSHTIWPAVSVKIGWMTELNGAVYFAFLDFCLLLVKKRGGECINVDLHDFSGACSSIRFESDCDDDLKCGQTASSFQFIEITINQHNWREVKPQFGDAFSLANSVQQSVH